MPCLWSLRRLVIATLGGEEIAVTTARSVMPGDTDRGPATVYLGDIGIWKPLLISSFRWLDALRIRSHPHDSLTDIIAVEKTD